MKRLLFLSLATVLIAGCNNETSPPKPTPVPVPTEMPTMAPTEVPILPTMVPPTPMPTELPVCSPFLPHQKNCRTPTPKGK